ncbi:plasmid stability protein StbB, partial [Pseudomonas syringae pv. tagetis]
PSMISSLASLAVPPEKIHVLFNRDKKDGKTEFPIIFAYHQRASAFTLNTECALFESELFDALSINRISMKSVMDDD